MKPKRSINRRRLALPERLECRIALSADGAAGVLWGNDARLTLSFAPDGTYVENERSELFTTFDGIANRDEWQSAILEGFQNWAIHTNSDIGLVDDTGVAFGAPGANHHDPRFGDVRVGAIPLDDSLYAISVSFDEVIDGTWAGELLFNTNADIDSIAEILAISAHEAGNVFGLEDSTDPLSPLYDLAIPTVTEPTETDIADLQTLHGARAGDIFDTEEFDTGDLGFIRFRSSEGIDDSTAPSVAFGEISGDGQLDIFEHEIEDDDPNLTGQMTVRVVTSGISQLAPSLVVKNQNGQTLHPAPLIGAAGSDLEFNFSPVNTSDLILEVGNAETGAHSIGGYSLVIEYGQKSPTVTEASLQRLVDYPQRMIELDDLRDYFEDGEQILANDDFGINDLPGNETSLETAPGFIAGTRYQTVASIETVGDLDRYQVTSPSALPAGSEMATIDLQSIASEFQGQLIVTDSSGTPVDARTIIHNDDQITVQFPIGTDETFFIEIDASPYSPDTIGSYELMARFGTETIERQSFVNGYLGQLISTRVHRLEADRAQLFHFIFEATSNSVTNDAVVTMTIRNASGKDLFTLTSRPGETRSGAILLPAGDYTLTVASTLSTDGTPIGYQLSGATVDDPLGPRLNDPTDDAFDFDPKRFYVAAFFPF